MGSLAYTVAQDIKCLLKVSLYNNNTCGALRDLLQNYYVTTHYNVTDNYNYNLPIRSTSLWKTKNEVELPIQKISM